MKPWFSSSYDNVQAYLKTLFHYFASWTERSPGSQDRDRDRDREISYIRRSRPARDKLWDDDISTGRGRLILPEIDIRITGSIGDTFQHVVEIDFANEDPCFGVGALRGKNLESISEHFQSLIVAKFQVELKKRFCLDSLLKWHQSCSFVTHWRIMRLWHSKVFRSSRSIQDMGWMSSSLTFWIELRLVGTHAF